MTMSVDFFWRRVPGKSLDELSPKELGALVPHWFDPEFKPLCKAGTVMAVERNGCLMHFALTAARWSADQPHLREAHHGRYRRRRRRVVHRSLLRPGPGNGLLDAGAFAGRRWYRHGPSVSALCADLADRGAAQLAGAGLNSASAGAFGRLANQGARSPGSRRHLMTGHRSTQAGAARSLSLCPHP
ncbi:hypothetical protein [Streptomyces sp. NPDC048106]|uniref:hypothetical protein n=1 Tax=Streptomyces sp. NPDC048106 TaxID=3155750 RepID=UPI0034535379